MSVTGELLSRRLHLPPAESADVVCERDLRVPMDDHAVLLADRWVARHARRRAQPTVLVRSPYGRRQWVGALYGRLLAERGLQVLVQSVRGTFGSQGRFNPFDERADGLATLRWIRAQPWHRERIGMIGPSYMGLAQWALASEAGDDLAAIAIQASASQFYGQAHAGGSLTLQTAASWLLLVGLQERRLAPLAMAGGLWRLPALLAVTPPAEIDRRTLGAQIDWFHEALMSRAREDPYWAARDFAAGVERVEAPVQLVGGWQDIFLPWMLEDFAALQAAGRRAQLIIGPWTHVAPGMAQAGVREGIAWLRAHLLDDDRLLERGSVRVFVTGERAGGGWRRVTGWPPPGTRERRLWLAAAGRLQEQPLAG
ncbi:MAG: CocE/NonD family hydrolase, partial [Solirubrobacterales bacterium]|nr:CocE/NonD family hydrolase [Solirubrobacterales bacterium]